MTTIAAKLREQKFDLALISWKVNVLPYRTAKAKEESMQVKSRGEMNIYRLFGVRELGLRDPESHLDRVIRVFLSIGEAVAARWIQMPKAIFLLQVAPENPASGAIYVYDRTREEFYLVTFEGAEDNLTVQEFGEILTEYKLLDGSAEAMPVAPQPGIVAAA